MDQWSPNAGKRLKKKENPFYSSLSRWKIFGLFSWFSSTELQKPFAGQPTVGEVLEVVLKECRKESLVYKVAALRCAADVLQSSQEDRFSTMAEILFPLIKKVCALFLTSFLTHSV